MTGLVWGFTSLFIGVICIIASMTIWGLRQKMQPESIDAAQGEDVPENIKKLKKAQRVCQVIGVVFMVVGVVIAVAYVINK